MEAQALRLHLQQALVDQLLHNLLRVEGFQSLGNPPAAAEALQLVLDFEYGDRLSAHLGHCVGARAGRRALARNQVNQHADADEPQNNSQQDAHSKFLLLQSLKHSTSSSAYGQTIIIEEPRGCTQSESFAGSVLK